MPGFTDAIRSLGHTIDAAEHFVRQCKLELERHPRSTVPHVVSRDWLAGAADGYVDDPDDYRDLPLLLQRQAA
jgi:hypothetical protein